MSNPIESGGGDEGAWLLVFPEGVAGLLESQDDFMAVMFPLCRWYMGKSFVRPQGVSGVAFDMMQAAQARNLQVWHDRREGGRKGGQAKGGRKAEAARANGRKGGRPRNAENPSTALVKNPSNETETKPNSNKTKTEKETKPRAHESVSISTSVFESDSILDSISAASDGIAETVARLTPDELMRRAADAIGDRQPSIASWRDFIDRHGKAAFREAAHEVCEQRRNGKTIANGGAYLNALLAKYDQTQGGGV